jgi:hypothetical protein
LAAIILPLTVLPAPAATPATTATHVIIVAQAACAEGVRALVELNHELQKEAEEIRGNQGVRCSG